MSNLGNITTPLKINGAINHSKPKINGSLGYSTYKVINEDYEKLKNKPRINGVELSGEKSLDDLGIQRKGNYANANDVPTKTSDLPNDSNYVSDSKYVHTDNNFTDENKSKLESLKNYDDSAIKEDISNIEAKNTEQDVSIVALQDKIAILEYENAQLKDQIKDQNPTGEAEGNPIHLLDSSNGECEIAVIGNVEQNGTPTPEVPVEIVTVGQEINYVSNDPSAWEQGTISGTNGSTTDSTTRIRTKGFVDIRNSAKITCNLDNTSYKVLNIHFYNENYEYLRNSSILYNVSNFNKATMALPVNTKYIKVVICKNSNKTITNTDISAFTIKIEKGSIAIPCGQNGIGIVVENGNDTTQSQSKLLPIQKEMLKIGDVEDTFVKQDGKWYEQHNFPKIIADGTNINWYKAGVDTVDRYSTTEIIGKLGGGVIATHFQNEPSSTNIGIMWLSTSTGQPYINFAEYGKSTVGDLNSWLAEQYTKGTPVEIYYSAKEPELIPCTPEQEEILNSFHTYKNVTNITASGIANLKVNYRKDLATVINNLSQAIIGGN